MVTCMAYGMVTCMEDDCPLQSTGVKSLHFRIRGSSTKYEEDETSTKSRPIVARQAFRLTKLALPPRRSGDLFPQRAWRPFPREASPKRFC